MTAPTEKKTGASILRFFAGFGLLLPAMCICLFTLLIPTVNTLLISLENIKIASAEFVGLENYSAVLKDPIFSKSLGLTFTLMLARVLSAAVVPLLLAVAVNEFGRRWRTVARLLAAVPLALFAPVSAALAWSAALNPRTGIVSRILEGLGLDPIALTVDSAPSMLIFLEGLLAAGIACGIGLPVFLAALRGCGDQPPTGKQIVRPLLISWLIGLLAIAFLPFPAFETSWLVFHGGPVNSTQTLGTYLYRQAFVMFRPGIGAVAAVLALCIAMLAGIIVGLIAVFGRVRMQTVPPGKPSAVFTGEGKPKGRRTLFAVLAAWMLLNLLCLLALGLTPILGSLTSAADGLANFLEGGGLHLETIVNTVLPPLVMVVFVQLPLAYLGALGIGALRPLGKWSEAILLPFTPWLLVTVFPLSIAYFEALKTIDGLDNWNNLFPPIALSIPMLFILTLFFKGQESKWRAAQTAGKSGAAAFFREVILPSLPLALLLAAAAFLANTQDFIWPLVSVNSEKLWTIPVFLNAFSGQYASDPGLVAAANVILEAPIFIVFYAIFALFSIFYLDRLAIVGGESNK
jgi:ABC-type sugar transport system permease subunit/ABC-type maltose transport system permease subunit